MSVPDLSQVNEAARTIVLEAKQLGKLNVLTPRLVRQEVETKLGLTSGTLDAKEYKDSVKDVIRSTIDEQEDKTEIMSSATDKHSANKRRADSKQESVKPSKKPKAATDSNIKEVGSSSQAESSVTKKSNKKYKSAVNIESSDEEGAEREKGKASDNDKKNRNRSGQSAANQTAAVNAQKLVEPEKSDSELSVLIDESPKRKKESKAKSSEKPKKQKKPAVELSKDEETVKRLKSFVYACGVRKVWTKELQGLDKPSQQIKRLREILEGLGMTGRLSLEQARAIKGKRELAQELEDVKTFEKSVMTQSTRSRVRDKSSKPTESASRVDDSDAEDEQPARHKTAARRSIMAFLEDQSESE